jgi:4-amino-4-deoxy-L-arabinose transferase-like glycosyltransferase
MLLLPAAALGVPYAARHRPVWLAWAAVALVCLLVWPTKWPQYTLLARPPLTVLAGLGLVALKDRLLGLPEAGRGDGFRPSRTPL